MSVIYFCVGFSCYRYCRGLGKARVDCRWSMAGPVELSVWRVACVAGVKRGRGRGNLGARGRKERKVPFGEVFVRQRQRDRVVRALDL